MMMRPHSDLGSIAWYVKYVGVPVTLSVIMFRLFKQRRRKAELQGKVVLITGASSGIGEALAHAFYEQGSKVILVARRESELNRVKNDLIVKKIAYSTEEPIVMCLDLADVDHMNDFTKKVYDVCGHIDILINNGGVSHRDSVLKTTLQVDKQIMFINYLGTVALTKAVLPNMVERRSGHIVFVSSVQGLIAIPERSAYAASKHALQAFGDSLRAEMHQYNINVTMVSPGYVKTAVSLNALTGDGGRHGVMDASTAAGFSPEYVAMKILDAVVYKDKELIISQFLPNLAIFLRHFCPAVYFWFMVRRANKVSLQDVRTE